MTWFSKIKNPARVLSGVYRWIASKIYLRPLLEALSGLILAFAEAVAVLT
jgi:hypothetical protein